MIEMTEADALSQLAAAIDKARSNHEPVYLRRDGHRIAALIDADDLAKLIEAAEDLSDLKAVAAARAEMAETGQPAVSLATLQAELGPE